jgi:DeoR/GlpR family transcriptional regulator of sugar metabolism
VLAANRHEEIIKLINKDRFVKVSQLSKMFDVSEETIRRDLDKLERDGLLKKLHGGAVPMDIANVEGIKPVMERMEEHAKEKALIARLALELIDEGDTLILDSGSTTLQLARILDNKKVTVITNDIGIAYELSTKENVSLIVTGGNLNSKSLSMVGTETAKYLSSFNVNKVFLSASGIKPSKGFTASNNSDAVIKKVMIGSGDKVICLAVHSKVGRVSLVSFADFKDIDIIITDRAVESVYEKTFRDNNIALIIP